MAEQIFPSIDELLATTSVNQCSECEKSFSNAGALRLHSVKTHRKLNLSSDVALLSRNNVVEKKSTEFFCPDPKCSKKYSTKRQLVQHYNKVHGEKKHCCEECDARFALARDLKYHQKKLCVSLGDERATLHKVKKIKIDKLPNVCVPSTSNEITMASSQNPPSSDRNPPLPRQVILIPCILKPVKTTTETQTDLSYVNADYVDQYMTSEVETMDFGVQHEPSAYDNVTTYDQGTMYESQTTSIDTSTYYNMNQHVYYDNNSASTQTYVYQGYENYAAESNNMGTQTVFEPLEQWFGQSNELNRLRDFGGMTDLYNI